MEPTRLRDRPGQEFAPAERVITLPARGRPPLRFRGETILTLSAMRAGLSAEISVYACDAGGFAVSATLTGPEGTLRHAARVSRPSEARELLEAARPSPRPALTRTGDAPRLADRLALQARQAALRAIYDDLVAAALQEWEAQSAASFTSW